MNKSTVFLISLMVVLAGVYAYFFTDLFNEQIIQIVPQSRPNKPSNLNPDVYLTSFMLDGEYPLSTVKVFVRDEYKNNRYAKPIWHLVSETNSKPTKVVHYGMIPQGMKPSVAKARPKPLEPHIWYYVEVQSGKAKGSSEFQAREVIRKEAN